MMRPCKHCLCPNWTFEYVRETETTATIIATCKKLRTRSDVSREAEEERRESLPTAENDVATGRPWGRESTGRRALGVVVKIAHF